MLVKEVSRKSLKYFELNESENPPYQNVWNPPKTILEKFIALIAYTRNELYKLKNLAGTVRD